MLIHLQNVNKKYKDKHTEVDALKNINIEIQEGEMIAIMGASGSGKSTLLNILGCLDCPTEGTYLLDGKNIVGRKEKEMARLRNEMFGFVLQDFALVERHTVAKNVMLPLYYGRVSRAERKSKVDEILKLVGLSEKKDMLAMQLSGGQRQRVAIARAIINDAKILLCDEPTGALDQKTSAEIVDVFKSLHKQGKTIIIVTHDPDVAAQCEKTIYIVDGVIQ